MFAKSNSSTKANEPPPVPPEADEEVKETVKEANEFVSELFEHTDLGSLAENDRFAICGLTVTAMHHVNLGQDPKEWCKAFVSIVAKNHLGLEEEKAKALGPLLPGKQYPKGHPLPDAQPWLEVMGAKEGAEVSEEFALTIFRGLIVRCIVNPGYDARVRTVMRYLALYCHLDWHKVIEIEDNASARFHAQMRELNERSEALRQQKASWGRIAKIAGASALAGTALALTGGLAAPAIIGAGATIFGTTALSTILLSAPGIAAMTAMFGTAGVGLGGYKMDRRTSGISEFEFKLVTGGTGMAVYICISGWLESENEDPPERDFVKPWGDCRERLRAFYKVARPERLSAVDKIAEQYKGREDVLFQKLEAKYGAGTVFRCAERKEEKPPADKDDLSSLSGDGESAGDKKAVPMSKPGQSALLVGSSSINGGEVDEAAIDHCRQNFDHVITAEFSSSAPTTASNTDKEVEVPKTENVSSSEKAEENSGVLSDPDESFEDDKSSKKSITSTLSSVNSTIRNFAPLRVEGDEYDRAWHWRERIVGGDQLCLVWESQVLKALGKNMRDFLLSQGYNMAVDQILTNTVGALMAAVVLPSWVLKACSWIDDVWVLALDRADKAGRLLAKVLMDRAHGQRPVTLIGYSMGGRVVQKCLEELSKHGMKAAGLIENAVILGAPTPTTPAVWSKMKIVVAGRLINGFSSNDWMLKLMYRYKNWAMSVAGISVIEVPEVENVDLSSVIPGHMHYRYRIGEILDLLKLEASFPDVVTVGEEENNSGKKEDETAESKTKIGTDAALKDTAKAKDDSPEAAAK